MDWRGRASPMLMRWCAQDGFGTTTASRVRPGWLNSTSLRAGNFKLGRGEEGGRGCFGVHWRYRVTPCMSRMCHRVVMAHTRHTGRAAWLWYHMVTLRLRRRQQARAARRWQQSAGLRFLAACGVRPVPSRFERFVTAVFELFESEFERSRHELRAQRQLERSTRHLWPSRYR